MSTIGTCSLCPRLCRTACPVATSGREAAVPTLIATVIREWEEGRMPAMVAAQAVTLCTDCGACQARCHKHKPLPEAIRAARAQLVPAPVAKPVPAIEGAETWVAVLGDDRDWAAALAGQLGREVGSWSVGDLGAPALDGPDSRHHLEAVAEACRGRVLVVAHGDVARVLTAAGVAFRWLHDVTGFVGLRSCVAPGKPSPLACCGAAGPLAAHHPADAKRVADVWASRASQPAVRDACCRNHLVGSGAAATDAIDALLEQG